MYNCEILFSFYFNYLITIMNRIYNVHNLDSILFDVPVGKLYFVIWSKGGVCDVDRICISFFFCGVGIEMNRIL